MQGDAGLTGLRLVVAGKALMGFGAELVPGSAAVRRRVLDRQRLRIVGAGGDPDTVRIRVVASSSATVQATLSESPSQRTATRSRIAEAEFGRSYRGGRSHASTSTRSKSQKSASAEARCALHHKQPGVRSRFGTTTLVNSGEFPRASASTSNPRLVRQLHCQ